MNLMEKCSIEELKSLLLKCCDSKFNHIIWVSKNGNVLIEEFDSNNPSANFEQSKGTDLQFWVGVFYHGHEYVGEDAANDEQYVNDLYANLIDNWSKGTKGHLRN